MLLENLVDSETQNEFLWCLTAYPSLSKLVGAEGA